jgi:membrane protease YdiL (CAAX protease family)
MAVAMLVADRKITISRALFQGGSPLSLLFFAVSLFAFNLILGGSLGEEPGWRGYVLPRLLENYRPLVASLILGVIWAGFHAPIDLSHGFMGEGVVAILTRLIWTLPLTLLFTYFFMNTNGSLLIAILLHTSVNFAFEFFQPGSQAIGIFSVGTTLLFVLSFLVGR